MRLILSRKGFDSSSGGCASPILPGGRLLTLPIPSEGGLVRYRDLASEQVDIGQVVQDLSRGAVSADAKAHLDPDLARGLLPREKGWRPAFGQIETAQIHLSNKQVGPGDLFLFFGWFREVANDGGHWRYRKGSPDLHVLFGWLQVGDVIDVATDREAAVQRRPWLRGHPHFASSASPNVVYVATEHLSLDPRLPGAGTFSRVHPDLVLTNPGKRLRSHWLLPAMFAPGDGRPPLSYHEEPTRWTRGTGGVELVSVARGQEFVLDLDVYPEVKDWAVSIVKSHGV